MHDGKAEKRWVLALTSTASFMAALDALAVTTVLDTMRHELSTSLAALQWVVNGYNLSFAVLLLTGAALGDRFGRRRLFTTGLLLFTAASLICGLAGNARWLIAGRVLQGAGAALLMPLAMALLSAAFPREERARALGLFGGITGLALIAGPVVGGAIAQGSSWQWIFWINLPIGLVAAVLAVRRVPESRGAAARLDLGGIALSGASAFSLIYGLMTANAGGWDVDALVLLMFGGLLAAGFVVYEARTPEPMLPLPLFQRRGFAAAIASSFLLFASMYGVLFFVAQFFQTVQELGPLDSGLRMLPWTATLFVFAPLGGVLVARFGERNLTAAGLLLQAAGMALLSLLVTTDHGYADMVLPMVVAGAGVSMAMPAAQTATMNAVGSPELGKASGAFNMFRFLGGAFGIAVLVAVFGRFGDVSSPKAFSVGFAAVLVVAALISAISAGLALLLPARTAPRPLPATAER